MARKAQTDDALFGIEQESPTGPGPVYQGVAKQLRALIANKTIDRDTHAGIIAAARSIAASIDRVSGHRNGPQASGMQLSALHSSLLAWLDKLVPAEAGDDPWSEFLEEVRGDSTAPASHPEV